MHNPLAPALRKGLVLAATLLLAPAFAAPAATVVDPSALVRTAAGKEDAKARDAGAKDAKAKGSKAPDAKNAKAKAKVSKDGTKDAKDSAKDAKDTKDARSKDAKADPGRKAGGKDSASAKGGKKGARETARLKPGPLADFRGEDAPPDVVHVANWASYTRNHGRKAFVVIDKKNAQLYVFDPGAKLRDHTPVLLGKAVGDDSAPGIGNKPLSQIKEEEKTTPAGRFLAAPGRNNHGEDIIWIDYASAVSMHRLRKVSEEEKRAERMATPEADDNRISNGCVNVPPDFYNKVLRPTVHKHGAYVYVLPETRGPQQMFGSFDVPANPGRKMS
jgi:hypothetical protein